LDVLGRRSTEHRDEPSHSQDKESHPCSD
jgi:hypothetical protein